LDNQFFLNNESPGKSRGFLLIVDFRLAISDFYRGDAVAQRRVEKTLKFTCGAAYSRFYKSEIANLKSTMAFINKEGVFLLSSMLIFGK